MHYKQLSANDLLVSPWPLSRKFVSNLNKETIQGFSEDGKV
jgi:hypothetical protein